MRSNHYRSGAHHYPTVSVFQRLRVAQHVLFCGSAESNFETLHFSIMDSSLRSCMMTGINTGQEAQKGRHVMGFVALKRKGMG